MRLTASGLLRWDGPEEPASGYLGQNDNFMVMLRAGV